MHVRAYCAAQFQESTRRAAGVEPFTCPPYDVATLPPLGRVGAGGTEFPAPGLLYLALHGRPGEDALYGDDGVPALTVDQVRGWDLAGCVVFAATCYLPVTPFLEAFRAVGAVVIAGPGPNYTPAHTLAGASLLGLWVRRGLELGLGAEKALALARIRVYLQIGNRAAARDALEFQLYT